MSTIILNFDGRFAQRQSLRKYHYWNSLNRRYNATVSVIEEDFGRAHIRFPPGAYSDMTLKNILGRYRHLPGISSVRMDTETYGMSAAASGNFSAVLQELIPKRRSLESFHLQFWIRTHVCIRLNGLGLGQLHREV